MSLDLGSVDDLLESQETGTLSKSQKKRMKRKAASKKKDTHSDAPQSSEAEALNPHVKLRSDLVDRGFTPSQVGAALDEMWELQLPYDQFDAALAFLEQKMNPTAFSSETEAAGVSSAAPVDPSPNAKSEGKDKYPPPLVNTTEAQPGRTLPPPATAAHAPPPKPKPMDLAAKLDMVASYENLCDAVVALMEWCSKAAKPSEIADLCAAQKTSALPTIIRRSILECPDEKMFDSSVLPRINVIIGVILRSSGVSSVVIDSNAANLSSVIRQARSTASKSTAESMAIIETLAENVAKSIVKSIARATETASSESETESVRQMDEEIDTLASSPVNGAGGIVEIMTKRDTHRIVAEKSSTVMGIIIASSTQTSEMNGGNYDTRERLLDVTTDNLASLVGNDTCESFRMTRTECDNLRMKLEMAQSGTGDQRTGLDTEIGIYTSEQERINARIELLKSELDSLEAKSSMLGSQISEAEAKSEALDQSCTLKVSDIKTQLADQSATLDFEDSARFVLQKMQLFETSLLKSFTAEKKSQENGTFGENVIANKMGMYLVRMRNYFKAEADAVEFLQNRASFLEAEIPNLEREIQECTALGMTTNVHQMTQSLAITRENIAEDYGVVAALRGEAELMRDDITKRIGEFKAALSFDQQSNQTLHVSILNGILAAMSRIGISDSGGIVKYIASMSESGTGAGTLGNGSATPLDFSGTMVNPVHAHGMNGNTNAEMPVAMIKPPSPPKKFGGWGSSAGSVASKAGGKSLLDIQREELSAKNDVHPEINAAQMD
eukprot:scaffold8069_cov52-Attheya_sp.AAC.6